MLDNPAVESKTARRAGLLALGLTALGLAWPLLDRPAEPRTVWPLHALRIIVVYPYGGLSDDTARAIAQQLAPRLGVPVLVENRAGAGGSVGMDLLAKAPPDGHTLAFSAISPLTLSPHLSQVSYDALRDIAPVVSVMYTPVLVVGTPAFFGTNFNDLLAAAKARPGHIRWGTSGSGTLGHRVLEQVRVASNADITHVPYKGGGQQLTDALAGHFEILSTNVAAAPLQHIRSGRFKALAVGAPFRLAVLPDVPTLAELGFPQANLTSLFGIFAPGATPIEIVHRLNSEINAILQQPQFQGRLSSVSNLPAGGSAEEFARQIVTESRNNAMILRASRVEPE
jgi:tripartite-type tricarboxylate transporter receptor subunit TctC